MASRVVFRNLLSLTKLFVFLPIATAQIGTLTQDITTVGAFGLQKSCAQECMVYGASGSCPDDVLGKAIGCAEWKDCSGGGWSKNDCYCRQDLQNPAQAYITNCISTKCKVGDVGLDASTAGGIYSNYCKDKGYLAPTAPATIPATATTRGSGEQVQTTGGFANPSASSTSTNPSSSKSMPITTIIGIVVGSLVALIVAGIGIKMLVRCINTSRTPKPTQYPQMPPPSYQPPVYPMKAFPEQHFYPAPPESELTPDDSRSVISGTAPGFAPMAPTLLSGEHGYARGR